jgi:hypothetical protein
MGFWARREKRRSIARAVPTRQCVVAVLFVVACAGGEVGDGPFGVSFGPGQSDDDDAATKGGPEAGSSATDDGENSSSGGDSSGPIGESSDDGSSSGGDEGALDSAGESSSGEPPIDDGPPSSTDDGLPPPDDPMYSPCDPDEQECADGICLKIEDEYGNLLSAYCTGLCGIPQNDCDPPPSGDAEPACIIANRGESVCSLDCGDGEECPWGMDCLPFGESLFRCA